MKECVNMFPSADSFPKTLQHLEQDWKQSQVSHMGDKDTMAGGEGKRQTGISTGVLTAGPDAHPEKVWLQWREAYNSKTKTFCEAMVQNFAAKLSADSWPSKTGWIIVSQ